MDPELYENLSMKKKDKAILKIWGLILQNLIGHPGLWIKQYVHHAYKEKKKKKKEKDREVGQCQDGDACTK